jgi:hypothetical protein
MKNRLLSTLKMLKTFPVAAYIRSEKFLMEWKCEILSLTFVVVIVCGSHLLVKHLAGKSWPVDQLAVKQQAKGGWSLLKIVDLNNPIYDAYGNEVKKDIWYKLCNKNSLLFPVDTVLPSGNSVLGIIVRSQIIVCHVEAPFEAVYADVYIQ